MERFKKNVKAFLKNGYIRVSHVLKRRELSQSRGDTDYQFPDFMCIGGQKCGTSWLMDNLGRHPDVYVPDDLKYFDVHYFNKHFHKPLRFYSDYFKNGAGLTKGECTPAYGFMPLERIQWVKRVSPDLRILLLVRNPIERAWSQARMNLVSEAGRSIESITEEEFVEHAKSRRSLMRGNFEDMLDRWEQVFHPDSIKVLFFDDILINPKDLLLQTFEHIGVSLDVDWDHWQLDQVVNRGSRSDMPGSVRREMESLYTSAIDRLAARLGSHATTWQQSIKSDRTRPSAN